MRLQDEDHQDLKIKVIQDGTSVQSFLEEVIKIYVSSDKSSSYIIEQIKK